MKTRREISLNIPGNLWFVKLPMPLTKVPPLPTDRLLQLHQLPHQLLKARKHPLLQGPLLLLYLDPRHPSPILQNLRLDLLQDLHRPQHGDPRHDQRSFQLNGDRHPFPPKGDQHLSLLKDDRHLSPRKGHRHLSPHPSLHVFKIQGLQRRFQLLPEFFHVQAMSNSIHVQARATLIVMIQPLGETYCFCVWVLCLELPLPSL